jgi:hypothetical protein
MAEPPPALTSAGNATLPDPPGTPTQLPFAGLVYTMV